MKSFCKTLLGILVFVSINLTASKSQVKYDEGAMYIQGVTLLQHVSNPLEYYYLPTYPRLATKEDGTYEFLCLKYTGQNEQSNGGVFHALIEFSIPDTLLENLTKELRKKVPNARIAGQVPLLQPKKDDPDISMPSFEIVSAILNNRGTEEAMTTSVVTSGFAPLTVGSKAAVAALLKQNGATLLWNSFGGPTSDVSVAVHGYYEAAVKAYNAVVTAEMDVIYTHFSEMKAEQSGYKKEQIRRVVDSLQKKGGIKIDVFDRSSGLGLKVGDMEGILNLVTTKLTEIMFDTKTGWSKEPERVDPSLGFDPRGRQGDDDGSVVGSIASGIAKVNASLPIFGFLSPAAYESKDPKYITDNQYVLKDIKDIRSNKFYLNLSKATTIKVPFHTAGNLGGLYSRLGDDERYFRIVNMDDAAFEKRNINFQVDGNFVEAFDDIINSVAINFRKKYTNGQTDVTRSISFNADDLKKGTSIKEVFYPRLGITDASWQDFEYQVLWNMKGKPSPIAFPTNTNLWQSSNASVVSVLPPLEKVILNIDADRSQFLKEEIVSANIVFAGSISGEKKALKNVLLRVGDVNATNKATIYKDPNTPLAYKIVWYDKNGERKTEANIVQSEYIFLTPPAKE